MFKLESSIQEFLVYFDVGRDCDKYPRVIQHLDFFDVESVFNPRRRYPNFMAAPGSAFSDFIYPLKKFALLKTMIWVAKMVSYFVNLFIAYVSFGDIKFICPATYCSGVYFEYSCD